MTKPEVVVLIPHYNNWAGLHESLKSISDLEPVDVLIVDDGSIVKPDSRLLQNLFPRINNITVLYLEKNSGIVAALNKGLQFINEADQWKYISRLDCSDLCSPDRFKLQKEYLDRHPDVYLVGSWATIANTNYRGLYIYKLPVAQKEIKRIHYYKDAFVHSSIMFRTSSLAKTGFYTSRYPHCEDTEFCHRFIMNFNTANIPKPLVTYILDSTGISQSNYRRQKLARIQFSIDTFTFRYFGSWIKGVLKNTATLIFGPSFSTKVAQLLINRSSHK